MKATRKIAAKRLRLKINCFCCFGIRHTVLSCSHFPMPQLSSSFHSFPSSRSTRFGLSVLLYQHLRTLSNVNFREVKENQAFSKIFFAFEITAVDLLIFSKAARLFH